jgi:hypothetical protein
MAFVYPPDNGLLTKAESRTMTYAELAALRQRAIAGDASAAIAFEQLPQTEKRLADMLVKAFGGNAVKAAKPKKPKKAKPSKPAIREREAYLKSLLASDNPAEREMARTALGV